jgi:ATP-binding cassette subfamily B protein
MGDRMYLIGEGTVEVVAEEAGQAPRRLAQLHEGEHFGEIALLQDVPRTATVRAVTNVALLTLLKKDLDALMLEFPRLRAAIDDAIGARNAASG